MEPILINMATTEPYDRGFYRWLIVGIICFLVGFSAFNIYSFFGSRTLLNAYQEKIKRLDQTGKKHRRPDASDKISMNDGEKVKIEKQIRLINNLIIEERFPWLPIVDDIETSLPDGLCLQRIASGPELKSLVLEGDAKDSSEIAEFMDRLKKKTRYFQAEILSLSVSGFKKDQEEAERPIRFQISLSFQGSEMAPIEKKGDK